MQEAVPVGEGSMAAVMGMEADAVAAICAQAEEGEVCAPANYNGGNQIVISGHKDAVGRAMALVKEQKKKAIPLKVSAPFHCALMAPAAEKVAEALESIAIGPMAVPVISNVEATANQDSGKVKELLIRQVTGAVRWQESMENMLADGITSAIEFGHGTVIKGLLKRIDGDLVVQVVGQPDDIKAVEL